MIKIEFLAASEPRTLRPLNRVSALQHLLLIMLTSVTYTIAPCKTRAAKFYRIDIITDAIPFLEVLGPFLFIFTELGYVTSAQDACCLHMYRLFRIQAGDQFSRASHISRSQNR